MDIQSSISTANSSVDASGRAGSLESAATARKEAADSAIERKEAEASDTSNGVGDKVDIQA